MDILDVDRRATEAVAGMTLAEKAALCSGADFWRTRSRRPARDPLHRDDRRAPRRPPAAGGHGPGRHRRRRPGHVLPHGLRAGVHLGPGAGRGGRRGDRPRGSRPRRRRRARPGRERQAVAALRPQLRVLQRGPAPHRSDGGGLRPWPAGRRGRGVPEAPGRQQPGVPPDDDRRGRRRAGAARARAGRLRARRARGAAVVGDVRLQPAQRHLRLRQRVAARRRAAGRVGP